MRRVCRLAGGCRFEGKTKSLSTFRRRRRSAKTAEMRHSIRKHVDWGVPLSEIIGATSPCAMQVRPSAADIRSSVRRRGRLSKDSGWAGARRSFASIRRHRAALRLGDGRSDERLTASFRCSLSCRATSRCGRWTRRRHPARTPACARARLRTCRCPLGCRNRVRVRRRSTG